MHSNVGVSEVFWKSVEKTRVSDEQVLHRIEEEKLQFMKNIVKQKYADVMWGFSSLNALVAGSGGEFVGKKRGANREAHGQMTLYSGCRRKSMMKLRDWLKKRHLEKDDTPAF